MENWSSADGECRSSLFAQFPSTEASSNGAVFNLTTQKLEYLGQNGFPETARELHKLNFGPRIGLAYRITDKTVIRSAYGVVWIEQAGITTPFTIPYFPFLQSITQRTLDNVNPAFILSSGPSVAATGPTPDAGFGQEYFRSIAVGSGYVQQWNFAVQREITHNTSVELAYAGSIITHVGIPDTNINQLTAQQLSIGAPLGERCQSVFRHHPRSSSLGNPTIPQAQLLKPYSQFTNVTVSKQCRNHELQFVSNEGRTAPFTRAFGVGQLYAFKLIDQASSVLTRRSFPDRLQISRRPTPTIGTSNAMCPPATCRM